MGTGKKQFLINGGEDCFYWTEIAFHYRYAGMVAGGETIPPLDRMAQYPEAVNTYEEFTVFMEPVAGEINDSLLEATEFCHRGLGYWKRGEFKKARADLERAKQEEFLRPRPDSPGSFRLGEEEVVVAPDDEGAYNRLGVLYWRSGRHRRAIAQFEKAIELDPRLAIDYYNLGVNHEALGEAARAREYYRRALFLDPDLSAVRKKLCLPASPPPGPARMVEPTPGVPEVSEYSRRAEVLIEAGRFSEAAQLYREVIRLQPKSVRARQNLGGALYRLGRVDEAIDQYRIILQLDPENVPVRNNLGVALADRGDLEGALAEYVRALELDPGYAKAHNNRGNALFRIGELDTAADSYRRALDINPESSQARNNLGLVYLRQGRIYEAIEQFAEALRLNPDFQQAHLNLEAALKMEQGLEER